MENFDPNFLWGELPPKESDKVPKEVGDLVILSAMKMETPINKPPQQETGDDITIGPEHSTMEENVLYTIQLIQYAKHVDKLIDHAKFDSLWNKDTSSWLKACPPLPYKSESILDKKYVGTFPLRNIERRDTPFTKGEPFYIPNIGKKVSKEILFKFVGTICAHAGFDTAMQRALQILADKAESYFKKFIFYLRRAADEEAVFGRTGFPDAMERVYHEMGMRSITSMHDFYQNRILQYRDHCEARCVKVAQYYQALMPTLKSDIEEVERFSSEVEGEEEIPELHFPTTVEGNCEGQLQSSLEPGFQMLQSLEKEACIKFGSE